MGYPGTIITGYDDTITHRLLWRGPKLSEGTQDQWGMCEEPLVNPTVIL